MEPKIGDWDVRAKIWQRQAMGESISAIVRHFEVNVESEGYPSNPPYRQTIKRVRKQLFQLSPELINILPPEVQAFACKHRPDLDEELRLLRQGKAPDVVPKELIPEIKKLAKRLEWLIHVPKPELPLLDDETESRCVEEMMKGNARPYVADVMTMNTRWWCTDPSIHVLLNLNAEEEALFNRFTRLPASKKFKTILDEWIRVTNHYLRLVRSDQDTKGIKAAYQEAKQRESEAHSELWKAEQALHWST